MDEKNLSFDDFVNDVDPVYHEFVRQTHEYMLENECTLKMMLAKNGYVVSYQHGKKKRVIMNFVFRKSGLFARVYCDFIGHYSETLETIPEKMMKAVEKAPTCKRFKDPPSCNSKCSGYLFTMKDKQHQKCRYNCFLFAVDEESIPFIRTLLENELKCRNEAPPVTG